MNAAAFMNKPPRFGPQERADHGRGAADYSRLANNPG
jgi:hypothetical protein